MGRGVGRKGDDTAIQAVRISPVGHLSPACSRPGSTRSCRHCLAEEGHMASAEPRQGRTDDRLLLHRAVHPPQLTAKVKSRVV